MNVAAVPPPSPASGSVREFVATRIQARPDALLPRMSAFATYHEYCAGRGIASLTFDEFDVELRRLIPGIRAAMLGPSQVYVNISIPASPGTPVALQPANTLPI